MDLNVAKAYLLAFVVIVGLIVFLSVSHCS